MSGSPAAGPPERTGRAVLRRHPLLCFLIWFFTVGQAIAFAPLVLESLGVPVPVHPFIIASTLVGLALPALVITRLVEGPTGLRTLLASALRVRVAGRWWLLAAAAVPLTALALWAAIFGIPPTDALSGILIVVVLTLAQTVLGLVTANWAEELAWMGFVQSRLERGRSIRVAALLTAPLFALQHVSLAAQNGLVAGAVVLVAIAALAIPFRLLCGWLAARTGSVLLVGVLHAAGNAVAAGSGFGDGTLRFLYPDTPFGFAHLAAYGLVAVVVLVVTAGRFGDPARPTRRESPVQAPAAKVGHDGRTPR